MTGFACWWTMMGKELHSEANVTPKQLAEAAYNAAEMDELLVNDWGAGYAEGYKAGVRDQKALQDEH